jgi:xanthine dehydrogenase accessory factor
VNDLVFSALADAARTGESVALGIITRATGSSPQKLGAKAVFHADRKITGTLGGGCLEAEAQRLALAALKSGQPQTFELVLDHDFGWDDGLICGGKVTGVVLPNAQAVGENFWRDLAQRDTEKTWCVNSNFTLARAENWQSVIGNPQFLFTETLTPPCALWIAGSGHIAQAVAPLALSLDFAVSIFDDRPELANHNFFPRAVALHTSGNWGKLLGLPFAATPTFGLIVTRGHKHDALVLESWVQRPFQFLAMIGSARKARTIAEHFVKNQLATPEQMARVACPAGIKIAAQSVPEIAVSILAQFIEQRAARHCGVRGHDRAL